MHASGFGFTALPSVPILTSCIPTFPAPPCASATTDCDLCEYQEHNIDTATPQDSPFQWQQSHHSAGKHIFSVSAVC